MYIFFLNNKNCLEKFSLCMEHQKVNTKQKSPTYDPTLYINVTFEPIMHFFIPFGSW